MSMPLRYLAFALGIFLLACSASLNATEQGFLEGHLKIRSPNPVDLGDENAATVTPENYDDYPLLILSLDGQKEITRLTADENGNYRVALPPGEYVLKVQGRPRAHLRCKPQQFTIVSNQIARVDMDIVAVDQWRTGSTQSSRPD
jgi:hypothetical protein